MPKKPGAKSSGGASVRASRSPDATTPAREDARPTTRQCPSASLDNRVIYCGDNLEQLKKRALSVDLGKLPILLASV